MSFKYSIFNHLSFLAEYAILCTASELQNLLLERVKEMITLTEEETFDFLNCLYYHPAVLQLRLLQIQQQNPVKISI